MSIQRGNIEEETKMILTTRRYQGKENLDINQSGVIAKQACYSESNLCNVELGWQKGTGKGLPLMLSPLSLLCLACCLTLDINNLQGSLHLEVRKNRPTFAD